MPDEIEFDCPDCGHHVIAFGFFGFAEPGKLCTSCDWIRAHIPPEDHPRMRDLLGVPLWGHRA